MRVKHRPNRSCMLLLLACASGWVGVSSSSALAAPAPVAAPPPLIKTTVLPGETDLDKVYARERNANRKAARKAADRQKFGLPEKTGERGHGKKKAK